MAPPTLSFSSVLFAAGLVAVLATPRVSAQPQPLAPELPLVDASPSIPSQCPSLAGRDDGGAAVAWFRFLPEETAELNVRAVQGNGSLEPVHAVYEANGWPIIEELVATPAGYALQWIATVDKRRPHLALGLDPAAVPAFDVLDLGRAATRVSPRPVGGFVAAWRGGANALSVQLLDGAGAPEAGVVKLRARDVGSTDVVHRSGGDFIVYWTEVRPPAGDRPPIDRGVLAHRFDAAGRPLGSTFRLFSVEGLQSRLLQVRLAWSEEDTLAVAWSLEPVPGRRAGREQLFLRTFDPSGRPLGPPWLAADAPARDDLYLFAGGLAVDPSGEILLVVQAIDLFVSSTMHGLRLSSAGDPLGPPFEIASDASAGHGHVTCARAVWAGGTWVVAWTAQDHPPNGTSYTSRVFLRLFAD